MPCLHVTSLESMTGRGPKGWPDLPLALATAHVLKKHEIMGFQRHADGKRIAILSSSIAKFVAVAYHFAGPRTKHAPQS